MKTLALIIGSLLLAGCAATGKPVVIDTCVATRLMDNGELVCLGTAKRSCKTVSGTIKGKPVEFTTCR